jgi:hypothetical protein
MFQQGVNPLSLTTLPFTAKATVSATDTLKGAAYALGIAGSGD